MRDLIKIRAYSPAQGEKYGQLQLIWEKFVDETWSDYKAEWYREALTKPIKELDSDEEYIRIDFNDECNRNGLSQGDLLCVNNKQCYII